jgi:hypothetical protein
VAATLDPSNSRRAILSASERMWARRAKQQQAVAFEEAECISRDLGGRVALLRMSSLRIDRYGLTVGLTPGPVWSQHTGPNVCVRAGAFSSP